MNYFISEVQTDNNVQKTAGIKARDDIDQILKRQKYESLILNFRVNKSKINFFNKLMGHFTNKKIWDKQLKRVKKDDLIAIQFPIIHHSIFLFISLKAVNRRGGKIVLLVHDLETLRLAKRSDISILKRIRTIVEEKLILKNADYIVVHNQKMKKRMAEFGIDVNRIISLELFDYLVSPNHVKGKKLSNRLEKSVIIAGNLRKHKAGYIYDLPINVDFNLYGVGFDTSVGTTNNIHYLGSFQPDKLPYELVGDWGLVWDGPSTKTCTGVYGEYLKYNNPHKASLYLAAGIPIIIWREAALSEFVVKENCGIVVNDLDSLHEILKNITQETYRMYKNNAIRISEKVRNGYYTINAMKKIEKG